MKLLQKADVQIRDIQERYFMLSTNYENYAKVRSYLSSMKDDFGLDTMFFSETVTSFSGVTGETFVEKGLPPRCGNEFMVRGVYLVGQSYERMVVLAKEVADLLRDKGLSVVVHKY
jgi:hypothetical protein